jgi:hypothetical protein
MLEQGSARLADHLQELGRTGAAGHQQRQIALRLARAVLRLGTQRCRQAPGD